MSQSLISEPITPRRNICPPRLAISPPRMSRTLHLRDHSSIYNHRQLSRRLDYSNDSTPNNDSTPIHIELKHCSDDSECSICLSNDVNTRNGGSLSCNHTFHNDCIQKWFKISSCCPYCRTVVN